MKYKLLLLSFFFSFFACNSVKKTQKALNTGNYNEAIAIAVKNLRSNKSKEKHQPYVVMLEEAFKKATKRDLQKISFLKKENNASSLETIYNQYIILEKRQKLIEPLLPLYITNKNREAKFRLKDYSDEIIEAKNELSEYLYTEATTTLQSSTNKYEYRKVYDDLQYLQNINPNYKNTNDLLEKAYQKGLDYVFVTVKNNTEQIIPKRLEADLLNFNTYNNNDTWIVYHTKKTGNLAYDFGLTLDIQKISISPERINEKEIIQERQIKDGKELLLDENGDPVKDSEGEYIKVDKFKKIVCQVYQFTQIKSTAIEARVTYTNYNTQQLIERYPIASEFVFEHAYATYNGDKRALQKNFLSLITRGQIPFPSNEQMVYDTGEDLKGKLKNIIRRNKFRN